MRNKISKKSIVLYILVVVLIFYFALSYTRKVEKPDYGVSFNTIYARELGLNWKEVYDAIIDDLKVKRIRLSAHWNMVEENQGKYNFSELDYQMKKAQEKNVEVVFAVGKRLPRWPECHIPNWATSLSKDEQETKILKYIETTVNRYKKDNSIIVWQVENEPFLAMYATDYCENFSKEFLNKEIDLVRFLDEKKRPILITDSGELSTWRKSFKAGDVFGTTMYVYSWNKYLGDFRNPFLSGFFSFRKNLWNLFGKNQEMIIAELSLEPWLDKDVIEEKTDVQIHRMSPEKFDNVIEFAKKTGIQTQYLWGAEWWYYMKAQGENWYWNRAKELFSDR